jgi:hypothetical protein
MRVRAPREKAAARPENQQLRTLIILGVIGLSVFGLMLLLYLNIREPGELPGIIRYTSLPRGHDDAVVFPDTGRPPAGGTHGNNWQNCGVYAEPIETKYALHSLEHGAVWITYQPELSEAQVSQLRSYARGQSHILVSPYPGQTSPVVLSVWGIQLEVSDANDRRISQFISRYQQGPQTPERGASCTNGVGEPLR